VSRYAALAEEHYRRWLPRAYAQINNRAAFFQALEDEAQSQLEDLDEAFCGPDRDGETYAARFARYRWGRHMAEEVVLRNLLPKPEVTQAEREDARREAEVDHELTSALNEFQRLLDEVRDQEDA
jgi:hypothetical protein